jgi:hypothetical protein
MTPDPGGHPSEGQKYSRKHAVIYPSSDLMRSSSGGAAGAYRCATQRGPFLGFPAKNRKMTIQAIDIHEFKDGKIIRTWHTEDWLTGLGQLGLLEK